MKRYMHPTKVSIPKVFILKCNCIPHEVMLDDNTTSHTVLLQTNALVPNITLQYDPTYIDVTQTENDQYLITRKQVSEDDVKVTITFRVRDLAHQTSLCITQCRVIVKKSSKDTNSDSILYSTTKRSE